MSKFYFIQQNSCFVSAYLSRIKRKDMNENYPCNLYSEQPIITFEPRLQPAKSTICNFQSI